MEKRKTQRSLAARDMTGFRDDLEVMPETKILALYGQFPWMGGLVAGREVARVYVYRMDSEMLPYKPLYSPWSGFWYGHDSEERICFLDSNGAVIGRVSRKETIERAFARLSEAARQSIHFIFSYAEQNKTAIVYKMPDNLSMSGWLEMLRDAYKEEAVAA